MEKTEDEFKANEVIAKKIDDAKTAAPTSSITEIEDEGKCVLRKSRGIEKNEDSDYCQKSVDNENEHELHREDAGDKDEVTGEIVDGRSKSAEQHETEDDHRELEELGANVDQKDEEIINTANERSKSAIQNNTEDNRRELEELETKLNLQDEAMIDTLNGRSKSAVGPETVDNRREPELETQVDQEDEAMINTPNERLRSATQHETEDDRQEPEEVETKVDQEGESTIDTANERSRSAAQNEMENARQKSGKLQTIENQEEQEQDGEDTTTLEQERTTDMNIKKGECEQQLPCPRPSSIRHASVHTVEPNDEKEVDGDNESIQNNSHNDHNQNNNNNNNTDDKNEGKTEASVATDSGITIDNFTPEDEEQVRIPHNNTEPRSCLTRILSHRADYDFI